MIWQDNFAWPTFFSLPFLCFDVSLHKSGFNLTLFTIEEWCRSWLHLQKINWCILHRRYYLILFISFARGFYPVFVWRLWRFTILYKGGPPGKLCHGPHSLGNKNNISHLNSLIFHKVIHWWLVYSKNGPCWKQNT